MARIVIDIRCLSEGRRTGVEEYTLNLLENIFELDKKNEYVLFFNSFRRANADFNWTKKYPNVSVKNFRFPNKLLNFLFWYFNWPRIDQLAGGADLVFFPNIIFGAVSQKVKMILTVHDLSFERYPETFSRKRQWWHIFINPKKMCRRADRIIAVSESTRKDIISFYGIPAEKVGVVASGVSEKFHSIGRNSDQLLKAKEKYKLPYKFILYFGTVEPRKNIRSLIQAFNSLQENARETNNEEVSKYKLVLAGHQGWLGGEIFKEIKKSEFRESIYYVGEIEEDDKRFVFNLASLFVYPSFFEGFGFPALEAMSCGIPVIVSNNSSLPEIVGKAGIAIDPAKPQEIAEGMKILIKSRELREKLAKNGQEIVVNFNWKKTAREFLTQISPKML